MQLHLWPIYTAGSSVSWQKHLFEIQVSRSWGTRQEWGPATLCCLLVWALKTKHNRKTSNFGFTSQKWDHSLTNQRIFIVDKKKELNKAGFHWKQRRLIHTVWAGITESTERAKQNKESKEGHIFFLSSGLRHTSSPCPWTSVFGFSSLLSLGLMPVAPLFSGLPGPRLN